MNEQTIKTPIALKSFRRAIIIRACLAIGALGAMFFLPAWTLLYWQAWIYLIVLSIPLIFIISYLYKHDLELLNRRMRMRERQKEQKLIILLSWPVFLLAFIIPGFDFRYRWSHIPFPAVIVFDVLVLLGYLFVGFVFKANSYASRIIEVEKGQKVITTGPYSLVRHPMYLGVLVFYLFSPLALGSYWGVIPSLAMIPVLVARIIGEEKELLVNLPGYKEYVMKAKFRLLPGIW